MTESLIVFSVSGFFATIVVAVFSRVIGSITAHFSNSKTAKTIGTVANVVNQVASTIVLTPFYLAFCVILISVWVLLITLIYGFLDIDTVFKLFLIITTSLVTLQFIPKQIFSLFGTLINNFDETLRIPKNVTAFYSYLFEGKILVYLIAAGFTMINNLGYISSIPHIALPVGLAQMKDLVNGSILVFLAIDRVFVSLSKWIDRQFKKEPAN
jgi:hypothetical protein